MRVRERERKPASSTRHKKTCVEICLFNVNVKHVYS